MPSCQEGVGVDGTGAIASVNRRVGGYPGQGFTLTLQLPLAKVVHAYVQPAGHLGGRLVARFDQADRPTLNSRLYCWYGLRFMEHSYQESVSPFQGVH